MTRKPEPLLYVFVPGDPVPKGRPRFGRGRAYTPKTTVAYEQRVADATTAAMRRGRFTPFAGALNVTVVCVYGVPRSYRGERKLRALEGLVPPRPDLDNVVKSLLDGMIGVAFEDDKAVTRLIANKLYSEAAPPGAYIWVRPYDPSTFPVMGL